MKKGQIYTGIVDKIKFPNKGQISSFRPVQKDENGQWSPVSEKEESSTSVTVKNVIPGQEICFRIQKKRRGKAEGQLLEVLEKSPMEQEEANCPHFGLCGGCNYQTLPYEEQLRLKSGQVLDLIREVTPNADDIFEGIKPSPCQFGYRNKMEYTFGDEIKDGPLTLGMHKRGGFYDIVTVDHCVIVDEDFRKILSATAGYFRDHAIPFYHRMRHTGYLRHLLVRKAVKTREILIDLITTSQYAGQGAAEDKDPESECSHFETQLLEGWKQVLLDLETEGVITGILHTKNDSVADAVKNEGTEILYGQNFFYEELLGLKFRISPFSFFQTNSPGAEVLYGTARNFIRESMQADEESLTGKVVFDLYSGTGTIAQMLAGVAEKVVGVEIVEEAVQAATENAALNHLDNCTFIAGDVLKVLDDIAEKPDFIVLDPPRDGIHPKALDKIINFGVDKMVYISCKPTSLQRDLAILQERGYRVERMCCVDMFPGTVHVETVVLLSHKDPDSHIHVKVEFGEGKGKVPLDKIAERAEKYKPKEKVTYKKIKEYIEDKFGFKVHTAYIAEVKRAYGLPMYDAPNAVEELKQPRKHPTEEKVKAISDALVHFGLIDKKLASAFEIAHLSAV